MASRLLLLGRPLRECGYPRRACILQPRQAHAEGAALPHRTGDRESPLMSLNQLLREGEPQAQTLRFHSAGLRGTIELLEDVILHFGAHTNTGVRYLNPHL